MTTDTVVLAIIACKNCRRNDRPVSVYCLSGAWDVKLSSVAEANVQCCLTVSKNWLIRASLTASARSVIVFRTGPMALE